jgi:hypothetical protein
LGKLGAVPRFRKFLDFVPFGGIFFSERGWHPSTLTTM